MTDRTADIRWELAPAARPLLCGDYLPLAEWLASGQAEYVKRAPHREVVRVRADGLDVHIKRYRVTGARGLLRECLRPVKARREWEIATALGERGIRTHEPLGWGVGGGPWWPGDSFLITRTLPDAQPLGDYLETVLPLLPPRERARARQRIAQAFAAFLAHMHDVGVVHHDPHPGNVLVSFVDNEPSLALIDLHEVEIGRPVPFGRAFENLAIWNRYFALRATRADRLRAWFAYREAAREPLDLRMLPRLLEEATADANQTLWTARDRRSLDSNRYYQRVRVGDCAGHLLRAFDPDLAARIMADADGWMNGPNVQTLKRSPRSHVVAFRDGRGAGWVLKRFRVKAAREPWLSLLRHSPALRSWVFGHGLWERRLPTPRPVLVFHRYRRGLPRDGYLLAPLVERATDLADWVRSHNRSAVRQQAVAVARMVRLLHERGVAHRDLKAANVLIADDVPQLIDLVGASRPDRVTRRAKVQNLARLNASFLAEPKANRSVKLRFLRAYLNANLGPVDWRRWWRMIAAATDEKVQRNRQRGRLLA